MFPRKIEIKENQTNQRWAERGRDAEQMVRNREARRPAQKLRRAWRREEGNGRRRAQEKAAWGRQTGHSREAKHPRHWHQLLCLLELLLGLPSVPEHLSS